VPQLTAKCSASGSWTARLVQSFRRDQKGVSAIEFALVMPVMIMVYLLSVDVTLVLTADRRVTNIASSIGDLVGQATQINAAEMDDIFEAATAIISPMDVTTLSVVVTSVVADEDGNTTISWSEAYNGSGGTAGAPYTLPDGIVQPLESVIVASVAYSYLSPVSQFLTGEPWVLDEIFFLRPRRTNQVVFNP